MTTLTQPIAKLYKRCARSHHDHCPGSFETWSVCACDCHAGVSDARPAPQTPVTALNTCEVVAEAVAIVKRKPATKAARPGRVPAGRYKCYGHNSWADTEHPSGGEGTGPIDTAIFVNVISPALQAQLDTMARKRKG